MKTPPQVAQQLARVQLWVPSGFWSDHADRCPCDNDETDMAVEIRQAGRRTLIEHPIRAFPLLGEVAAKRH